MPWVVSSRPIFRSACSRVGNLSFSGVGQCCCGAGGCSQMLVVMGWGLCYWGVRVVCWLVNACVCHVRRDCQRTRMRWILFGFHCKRLAFLHTSSLYLMTSRAFSSTALSARARSASSASRNMGMDRAIARATPPSASAHVSQSVERARQWLRSSLIRLPPVVWLSFSGHRIVCDCVHASSRGRCTSSFSGSVCRNVYSRSFGSLQCCCGINLDATGMAFRFDAVPDVGEASGVVADDVAGPFGTSNFADTGSYPPRPRA